MFCRHRLPINDRDFGIQIFAKAMPSLNAIKDVSGGDVVFLAPPRPSAPLIPIRAGSFAVKSQEHGGLGLPTGPPRLHGCRSPPSDTSLLSEQVDSGHCTRVQQQSGAQTSRATDNESPALYGPASIATAEGPCVRQASVLSGRSAHAAQVESVADPTETVPQRQASADSLTGAGADDAPVTQSDLAWEVSANQEHAVSVEARDQTALAPLCQWVSIKRQPQCGDEEPHISGSEKALPKVKAGSLDATAPSGAMLQSSDAAPQGDHDLTAARAVAHLLAVPAPDWCEQPDAVEPLNMACTGADALPEAAQVHQIVTSHSAVAERLAGRHSGTDTHVVGGPCSDSHGQHGIRASCNASVQVDLIGPGVCHICVAANVHGTEVLCALVHE
jgi:hypothetical protein